MIKGNDSEPESAERHRYASTRKYTICDHENRFELIQFSTQFLCSNKITEFVIKNSAFKLNFVAFTTGIDSAFRSHFIAFNFAASNKKIC